MRSKLKLSRAGLFGVLLFQLVLGNTALSAPGSQPPLINFDEDFEGLVASLVAQADQQRKNGDKPVVRAIHIEGRHRDPRLTQLAEELTARDIGLQVFWVTEEEFDRVEGQLEHGDADKARQFIRFLQVQYPDLSRDKKALSALNQRVGHSLGREQFRAHINRLHRIKKMLFTFPMGITLVDHFVKTEEGRAALKYRKNWRDVAVSTWGALASGTAIGWGLVTTGLSTDSDSFRAIMGIVLFWEFVSTFFQKEIGSFFSQWERVTIEKNLDLRVREEKVSFARGNPNIALLLGFTLFHETLVSYLVTSLDSGVWRHSSLEWLNIGTNAAAAAFASLPVLAYCAQVLLKAELVKEKEPNRYRRLSALGYGLTFLYFGAVFPLFDGLQLSMGTEDIRAAIPFWTLGAAGLTYFAYTQKDRLQRPVQRLFKPRWKLLSEQCRMLFTTDSGSLAGSEPPIEF